MAKEEASEVLSVEGREVRITHPEKLYFSAQARISKLDLVRYYLSVAAGALAGIRDRPIVLKRFVNGAEGEAFYQKRAPTQRPSWLRTITLSFPSGRSAEQLLMDDAAGLAWIVNLGCIELHPHPVRSRDLDHPDELRIDLDPIPGVSWADVCRVALEVQAFLEEVGLRGWPKTSAMACSSTTTRTRRTGLRALRTRCARCPTPAFRRRFTGTRSRTAIRATSRFSRFRSALRKSAIRTQGWTPRRARSKNCLSSRQGTKLLDSAMHLGRRTFARWRAKRPAWRLHALNRP